MRQTTLKIAVSAAALATLSGLAAADGGDRPPAGLEAYKSASRTYPADVIPPAVVANARATFEGIAAVDAKTGDPGANSHSWNFYGPTQAAIQPGVTDFSGATNSTASRVTALVVAPDCGSEHCRIWVGVAGGSVWRTDNALERDPG